MRLIDTNIVSFLVNNDSRWLRYEKHIVGQELAVSFMTEGELYCGAELARWGANRRQHLESVLGSMSVLHTDQAVSQRYAFVRRTRRSQPISAQDAWIAATALRFDLKLVTHNPRDFKGIPGLVVISEVS